MQLQVCMSKWNGVCDAPINSITALLQPLQCIFLPSPCHFIRRLTPGPNFIALLTSKQIFVLNYSRKICLSIRVFHRLARKLRVARGRSPRNCVVASLIY